MPEFTELIFDLSEPRELNHLLAHIRSLQGKQRITIKQYRPRRSDRQNSWYWPCVVQPFAEWCREMGNDITDEEAHEFLKGKFLTKPVINTVTGEEMGFTVGSTAKLDTKEFNDYVDKCAQWLAEFAGIVVQQPISRRS